MDKFEPDFEQIRQDALSSMNLPNDSCGKMAYTVAQGASFVVAQMLADYHKQLTAYLATVCQKHG